MRLILPPYSPNLNVRSLTVVPVGAMIPKEALLKRSSVPVPPDMLSCTISTCPLGVHPITLDGHAGSYVGEFHWNGKTTILTWVVFSIKTSPTVKVSPTFTGIGLGEAGVTELRLLKSITVVVVPHPVVITVARTNNRLT